MCRLANIMIYKEDCAKSPENYRNITLANCILKLFTQILLYRLTIWAKDAGSMPECQAGFRTNRGCMDNIFVLTSIIYITQTQGFNLYTVVIDFKRAFDSINHQLLWQKLFDLGIPPRGAT